MRFSLMTYNIHKGIGGVDRQYNLSRTYETIAHYNPDVLLLQEVDDGVPRSHYHRQVDWLGDALELPHRAFQANVRLKHGAYGNAILSRFPLEHLADLELTIRPKKRRRALIVRLELPPSHANAHRPPQSMIVANVHLGLAELERRLQIRRLMKCQALTENDDREPTIIGGDFNDVWRTLGNGLMKKNLFRSAAGRPRTFPAVYPLRCLDYIYYRGDLQPHKAYAGMTHLARRASDHLPLMAEFVIGDSSENSGRK